MPSTKKVHIKLFGSFDIEINKKSVLTKGVRQQGFNKLFIFFLLNRDRVYEIDTLIERVWPNKEYQDNNSIMRTQIFRLKKQLTEMVPALDYSLEFTRGGYMFSYDPKNVVLDIEAFDDIYEKILAMEKDCQPNDDIIASCSEALKLYQSGFLNETTFDGSWIESYRQNYRRKWLRIIKIFTDLCNLEQRYQDIVALSQEILHFEDSEEYIHEIYMDALRKSGYHQDALKHFDIITAIPSRGEAFVNSSRLRDLQRLIQRETDNYRLIDDENLEQFIIDLTQEATTAVCEKDVFLRHCSILRLQSERSIYQPYICIIEPIGYNTDDSLYRKLADSGYLINIVRNVFRKCDILCEWNERQVLVLMACNKNFIQDILTRRIKLAVLRDNLSPEEAANADINLNERMYYLPLKVRYMPIGSEA